MKTKPTIFCEIVNEEIGMNKDTIANTQTKLTRSTRYYSSVTLKNGHHQKRCRLTFYKLGNIHENIVVVYTNSKGFQAKIPRPTTTIYDTK